MFETFEKTICGFNKKKFNRVSFEIMYLPYQNCELTFEKQVLNYLRTQGFQADYSLSIIRYYGQVGIPDFCVTLNGEDIFIEVKSINNGFSQNQLEWIATNPNKRVILLYPAT